MLRQRRQGCQFMDVRRRDTEADDHAGPLQPDMHAQAVEGLARQRIFAEGCCTAEAIGAGELADR
jgi:hypothetical protein